MRIVKSGREPPDFQVIIDYGYYKIGRFGFVYTWSIEKDDEEGEWIRSNKSPAEIERAIKDHEKDVAKYRRQIEEERKANV